MHSAQHVNMVCLAQRRLLRGLVGLAVSQFLGVNGLPYCCRCVIGFDVDDDALKICQSNLEDYEIASVDTVQADVTALDSTRWHKAFDTVIMNPPFGTKHNEGKTINKFATTCI